MSSSNASLFTKENVQTFVDHAQAHIEAGKFGQFAGFSEENYHLLEQHAYTLYSKGHYDRARGIAEDLIMMDRSRHYPFLLLGDILIKAGEFIEARSMLEVASELEPGDWDTRVRLGEAMMKAEDTQEALKVFSQVLKEADTGSIAYRRAQRLSVALKTVAKTDQATQVA